MGGIRRQAAIILATSLLAVTGSWSAGCGEGESTGSPDSEKSGDSGTGPESTDSAGSAKNRWAGYPKGPTREFIVPGGDNWVQEFGREATAAERRQASATVEAWLRARVKEEWVTACSHMTRKNRAFAIEAASYYGGRYRTCAGAFAFLTLRSKARARNNISGGVVSLRIRAGEGYAQYHGKEGRDWLVTVQREDRRWKIETLYPTDRLK